MNVSQNKINKPMLKDKLNIVDPQNTDLGLMLGVTKERQQQIAKMLDEMVALPKEISLVYASSVIEYIEDRVDTREEFMYAFVNHMYYQLIKGHAIPQSLAREYTKSYPVDDLKRDL